jgi:hypothetical protein
MNLLPAAAPSARDVEYITANFRRLAELCHAWGESESETLAGIERGLLPRPTYVLANNLEFYPDDYFVFPREAAERRRKGDFIARLKSALLAGKIALEDANAERAWGDYISGAYGMCLRIVIPETIARKTCLISAIERALARPQLEDDGWINAVRKDVNALDALLRPFTELDRARAGAPLSRDQYVDAVREFIQR